MDIGSVKIMKKFSIVFYGINGQGLGHISRLLNVARSLKEFCEIFKIDSEIIFLTTSDAPQIASDFPVYKLPTIYKFGSEEIKKYTKFFIANMFGCIRPDVVVMDTNPYGAFNEFALFRDYCKKAVFINRHTDNSSNPDKDYIDLMRLYNLILTPDSRDNSSKYFFSDSVSSYRFVDKVHGFRPDRSMDRETARSHLNVGSQCYLVYISAGGGGDKNSEVQIETIVKALSKRPDIKILIGYGPLYTGKIIYYPNVIPYTGFDIRKYFLGIDAAVCAAGYNTFEELLAAKVPCAFYSQSKGMDRQDLRVIEGKQLGWNEYIDDINDSEDVLNKVEGLINNFQSASLHSRKLSFGAQRASLELIKLLNFSDSNEKTYYFVYFCYVAWTKLFAKYSNVRFSDLASMAAMLQQALISSEMWNDLCSKCLVLYELESNDVPEEVFCSIDVAYDAIKLRGHFTQFTMSEYVESIRNYFYITRNSFITTDEFQKHLEKEQNARKRRERHMVDLRSDWN
jgi:predicted glycosyltransferase